MDKREKYEFPSSNRQPAGYPFRVWAFSILITPLVITLWSMFESDAPIITGYVLFYFIWLFFLLIFSVPAGIMYMVTFWRLSDSNLENGQVKALLAIVAICSLYLETFVAKLIFLGEVNFIKLVDIHFLFFSAILLLTSLLFSLKVK